MTRLIDVHGALSGIIHAAQLTFNGMWIETHLVYRSGTYLALVVQCRLKNRQRVIDQLNHGLLAKDYDYRFSGVSYSNMDTEPEAWVEVTAYLDLHHPRKGTR